MKKRIIAVILLVTILFGVSGCGSVNQLMLQKKYGEFMMAEYDTLTNTAENIKSELIGLPWLKLGDEAWVAQLNGYLSTISSSMDKIVNYSDVPDKFKEMHDNIVPLAKRAKDISEEYIAGLSGKNLITLTDAGIKLAVLANDMGPYMDKIKTITEELK